MVVFQWDLMEQEGVSACAGASDIRKISLHVILAEGFLSLYVTREQLGMRVGCIKPFENVSTGRRHDLMGWAKSLFIL